MFSGAMVDIRLLVSMGNGSIVDWDAENQHSAPWWRGLCSSCKARGGLELCILDVSGQSPHLWRSSNKDPADGYRVLLLLVTGRHFRFHLSDRVPRVFLVKLQLVRPWVAPFADKSESVGFPLSDI